MFTKTCLQIQATYRIACFNEPLATKQQWQRIVAVSNNHALHITISHDYELSSSTEYCVYYYHLSSSADTPHPAGRVH